MVYITLQEDADAVRLDSLLDFKKQHFFARPYSSSENNYFFATDKIWMSSYNAVTVKTSDASLHFKRWAPREIYLLWFTLHFN